MVEIISVVLVVAGVLGMCAIGVLLERRDWNGGFCAACNKPWKMFDMDSQGGRGYSCESNHSCWISWPVDRNRKETIDACR